MEERKKYQEIDVNDFFTQEGYLNAEPEDKKVAELYAKLLDTFNKNTGLELFLCYHDEDDGDVYDEINGHFWHVEGVYQMTEAGEKFHDVIERKFYVTFG
jgi:hypothetical protein